MRDEEKGKKRTERKGVVVSTQVKHREKIMTQAGGNQEENKQMNRNKNCGTLCLFGQNEKLKQQHQKLNSDQIMPKNKRRLKLSIIFQ